MHLRNTTVRINDEDNDNEYADSISQDNKNITINSGNTCTRILDLPLHVSVPN